MNLAELITRRTRHPGKVKSLPVEGMWYDTADRLADGTHRCGFCGDPAQVVQDHCHDTGLHRGGLCHTCNFAEGNSGNDEMWEAWRTTAPLLTIGRRQFHSSPTWGLTREEVLTLPMAELLARVDSERRADFTRRLPAMRDAMELAFGSLCRIRGAA